MCVCAHVCVWYMCVMCVCVRVHMCVYAGTHGDHKGGIIFLEAGVTDICDPPDVGAGIQTLVL